ncbi:transposase [Streptomyces sp. NPDC020377]|uniref:transposase n=1 Tax=Streptomyces sp. NPDC020377 TaxID=3365070 RepID=UPI0037934FB0
MSLTDAQWARIELLLPDRKPKWGGRRRDHREVIDAIVFTFRTGTQWVHPPERPARRGPGGRAARPCHRTVARGTCNDDPSCCRLPRSSPRICPDRRSSGRRTRLHGRHGRPTCTASPRTASNQT